MPTGCFPSLLCQSEAKNNRPLASRIMNGRWLLASAGNDVLLTVQVFPPSREMDLGMNPSIFVFLPPMPRMLPSFNTTKVVWRPSVRPPVSLQVLPLSVEHHSIDSPPTASVAT